MKRLPQIFVFCILTACSTSVPEQVTKSYANEGIGSLTLPPIQGFVGPALTSNLRANSDIAQDFLNLEFRLENGRELPRLTRFDGPITVAMTGHIPGMAMAELSQLITRFRREAGLDLRLANPADNPSVVIEFLARAKLQRVVPLAACFVVPRVQSFAAYKSQRNSPVVDWVTVTRREHVIIFIPSDTSPQEVRDCLHEELAQAMGPLNDLYHLPDSVFNDDNFNTVLTGFDMLMLRLHYAPELHNGMTKAETARLLPSLLARLNPAGEQSSGSYSDMASPSWIAAVQAAFGPRSSTAARHTASDRMLGIALAAGWQDGKLAFSYYAKGRSVSVSDPAAAVLAFNKANQIYHSIPGAQVHTAHVDMQLAVIALAAGQNQTAIALADGALPVMRSAQNAAMMATLLLIKAQALESAGQADAAAALRLDSLGLARYGFGSAQQIRARMAEIAAIGSRGQPG